MTPSLWDGDEDEVGGYSHLLLATTMGSYNILAVLAIIKNATEENAAGWPLSTPEHLFPLRISAANEGDPHLAWCGMRMQAEQ